MKKILSEVVYENDNARWKNQTHDDRKRTQFSDVEHLEHATVTCKPRD